jgi:hypothetical protein
MARHDVSDLVTQHPGQLTLGFEPAQERGGNEYLAPGKGEGVYRPGVGQKVKIELVGGSPGSRPLDEVLPHPIDEVPCLLIRMETAMLPGHLRCRLKAQGNLLARGEIHILTLARDWILGPFSEVRENREQRDCERDDEPQPG